MAAELEQAVFGDQEDEFAAEVAILSNEELRQRIRALDNEIRIMKSDIGRLKHESSTQTAHIKDNKEKVLKKFLNKSRRYCFNWIYFNFWLI